LAVGTADEYTGDGRRYWQDLCTRPLHPEAKIGRFSRVTGSNSRGAVWIFETISDNPAAAADDSDVMPTAGQCHSADIDQASKWPRRLEASGTKTHHNFGHEAAGSDFWPTQRSRAAYAARFPGPNDSGNSSPNVTVWRRPSESQMCTGVVSSANSCSRWRQPPHGETRAGPLPMTSTSLIRRSPAMISAEMAEASAQLPCGNAAFSTLHPA